MNPNCKCGGRYVSIDPVRGTWDTNYFRIIYTMTRLRPGHATWKCNKCGKIQVQKLRQAKEQKQ